MHRKKLIIFNPSIENGGVEKNLFLISNYLATNVENVYLITTSKKFRNKFNSKINLITPKYFVWDKLGRKIKYLICLILLTKFILTNKRIVLFCFQANFYCSLICLFFPKIILITRSNTSPSGWSKNFLKRLIFKLLFRRINKVIVNSIDFRNQINNEFNIKSSFIYNPLNKTEIINKSKIKTKNYFKKNVKLKIICVGRFVDQKDQITLLKALNLIKSNVKFETLLLGEGKMLDKYKLFIKENSLRNKVKLIKFQKNPYPIIKQSNIVVLSSKYEGLPNILLEGLLLKKYIISSNCPTGPKEILDNGSGGDLFKVGNYNELAIKFQNFEKKNIKIINKKIEHGYKRLNRFDYKSNMEAYLKIVNNELKKL